MSSSSSATTQQPCGQLAIRTLAMPAYTNPDGHIFGGWVVSQMDLAGASIAAQHAKCRVVTAAIDSMSFLAPVEVGDFVCCYGAVERFGRSSIAINVEAWVIGVADKYRRQVTEGLFTFVAVDKNGKPFVIEHWGV